MKITTFCQLKYLICDKDEYFLKKSFFFASPVKLIFCGSSPIYKPWAMYSHLHSQYARQCLRICMLETVVL